MPPSTPLLPCSPAPVVVPIWTGGRPAQQQQGEGTAATSGPAGCRLVQ